MLLDMPTLPPLVVVTTYDQLFEDALVGQGSRRHVVVTHIVRSADGEHDGKILVLRRGQEPIITPADKVDVARKGACRLPPLGSPLLHAQLNPSWEIDTVVITETDHLTFLGRLENEHMTVPTRFNNWLRRKPLLFLGYGLDLWNYRLFMHVFRVIGERKPDAPILAVRKPTSDMEVASWERTGCEVGATRRKRIRASDDVRVGARLTNMSAMRNNARRSTRTPCPTSVCGPIVARKRTGSTAAVRMDESLPTKSCLRV